MTVILLYSSLYLDRAQVKLGILFNSRCQEAHLYKNLVVYRDFTIDNLHLTMMSSFIRHFHLCASLDAFQAPITYKIVSI